MYNDVYVYGRCNLCTYAPLESLGERLKHIVAMVSASQSACSLQHLPIKTPNHTVWYVTERDKAALGSLAAQLL